MTRQPKTLHAVTLAIAATTLVAACGGSTPGISRAKLEDTISSKLEKQVGTAPDKVECPDGLTGKVGETQRCMLSAGTDTIGVEATVTSVDGDRIGFDIQVDDEVQEDDQT